MDSVFVKNLTILLGSVDLIDKLLLFTKRREKNKLATINKQTNTIIIVPQSVYTGLSAAQKTNAIVLTYGGSTNVMGLTVEAVHAYNNSGTIYHPLGSAVGYVLTIGGQRIYFSGDTGNVPEIRALPSIDVAFLCMNMPFTMTANDATNAVRAFRPRIVYPYHYREGSSTTTNAAYFKKALGTDLGIEVRLRKWSGLKQRRFPNLFVQNLATGVVLESNQCAES